MDKGEDLILNFFTIGKSETGQIKVYFPLGLSFEEKKQLIKETKILYELFIKG